MLLCSTFGAYTGAFDMLGHIDEIVIHLSEFIRFLTVNEGLRLDVTVGIADIGLASVSVATGQRSNDIFNLKFS